jgi:hypothetical protein
LQFHWGKPPPAADPRTRIRTELFQGRKHKKPREGASHATKLAVGNVHRRFKTQTYFGVFRFGPHKEHLQQFELDWVLAGEDYPDSGRISMEKLKRWPSKGDPVGDTLLITRDS